MNKLLQFMVMDNSGNYYNLIGFRSSGDDRSSILLIEVTLFDSKNNRTIVVGDLLEMKKYTDLDKLLQIRVMNNITGKNFKLLGFRTVNELQFRGISVSGITVHDVDARTATTINGAELNNYSPINE